ncbi:MAG: hypothetical protein WAO83_23430 [Fuerstiella sp.]
MLHLGAGLKIIALCYLLATLLAGSCFLRKSNSTSSEPEEG